MDDDAVKYTRSDSYMSIVPGNYPKADYCLPTLKEKLPSLIYKKMG